MRAYSPRGYNMCPLFEQLDEKGIDNFQENILERLQDHSFTNILFNLPFDSLEFVCKARFERLVVNLPNHSFLPLAFRCFFHHIAH